MSEAQQLMEAPESRIVTREVDLKLNQTDLANMGKEAGDIKGDLMKLEDEFDSCKKDFAPRIKQLETKLSELLVKIKSGVDTRLVECTEIKDFMANTIKYVYDGETVEEVAMTGEQRQEEMFSHSPQILPAEDFSKEVNLDPKADLEGVIKEETSRTKFGIV